MLMVNESGVLLTVTQRDPDMKFGDHQKTSQSPRPHRRRWAGSKVYHKLAENLEYPEL